MILAELGWHEKLEKDFAPYTVNGLTPARVVREEKNSYWLQYEGGEAIGEITGKYFHEAQSRSDLPAVGDWVAVAVRPAEGRAAIHALLPRKSCLVRKAAGSATEEQILAANVDTLVLVSGLDADFNLRRIERYVTLAWESKAFPVILLNKADACDDVAARVTQAEACAIGVPVYAVSALNGMGLTVLRPYLSAGQTLAFLGSSGVGKSTIINSLLGEERLRVNAVRASDGRGQHTTTHRELILLPGGGIVIDTPGMRALGLWANQDSVERTFEDVDALALECRFKDCAHVTEPGCAVRAAIEEGRLDAARWQNYLKLKRELQHLDARQDRKAALIAKGKGKALAKEIRRYTKDQGRYQ
jgi:ribosome biogenesis GTPase / thiamine phosphate phosphatase